MHGLPFFKIHVIEYLGLKFLDLIPEEFLQCLTVSLLNIKGALADI